MRVYKTKPRLLKKAWWAGPGVLDPAGIEPATSGGKPDEVTITSTGPGRVPG